MSLKVKAVSVSIQNTRCFSVWSCINQKSLYDTLGLAPSASQADVKAAFYKLSKKHHPDTNINDPSSTAKFQEIVEAYEILGNDLARKRYDKGMPTPQGKVNSSPSGFKAPEDPQAAFYKSRLMNKMNSPSATRMYNFDTWTQEHYSNSVRSNRNMQSVLNTQSVKRQSNPQQMKIDSKFALVLGSFIILGCYLIHDINNHDSPRPVK